MSETLVEWMARAIDPIAWDEDLAACMFDGGKEAKQHSIQTALAALRAIREPSNAMLHACEKAMSPGRRPVPGRVSVRNKHRIRYRAMIDAAIAEAEAGAQE